jgi:D-sedoheptulose 7-phosphate isomerase
VKTSKEKINLFLKEQKLCLENMMINTDEIEKIIKILITARNNGKHIFTMGNGGSGSTSTHLVSDLLKTCITKNTKRFRANSLVDNIPVVLAWSNDVSYDDIFIEQLKNSLEKNDIIIAFSGSGNSPNVVKALRYGKKIGAYCIGFTGKTGGKMKSTCDICLKIPSIDMLTIESQHLLLCHCIANVIRKSGIPLFRYD